MQNWVFFFFFFWCASPNASALSGIETQNNSKNQHGAPNRPKVN